MNWTSTPSALTTTGQINLKTDLYQLKTPLQTLQRRTRFAASVKRKHEDEDD